MPHPYIAMVPQWDLLNLLAEAGAAEPSFALRMATEVTALVREPGQVRRRPVQRQPRAPGRVRADLVVAADGRWSIARRRRTWGCGSFGTDRRWWFRLSRHDDHGAACCTPRCAGRFAVRHPASGFFQIAYIARKGADRDARPGHRRVPA